MRYRPRTGPVLLVTLLLASSGILYAPIAPESPAMRGSDADHDRRRSVHEFVRTHELEREAERPGAAIAALEGALRHSAQLVGYVTLARAALAVSGDAHGQQRTATAGIRG